MRAALAYESNIVLKFQRVRWHGFTAVYNCSADQIQSAYFKLMRLEDSERQWEPIGAITPIST